MSLERTDRMTTETATADDLGAPTAEWLRARGYSAKKVGRVLGRCEGIGKQILAGRTPTGEQMALFAKHFGWKFVQHIFSDLLGPPSDAALAADLEDIKRRLARLEV